METGGMGKNPLRWEALEKILGIYVNGNVAAEKTRWHCSCKGADRMLCSGLRAHFFLIPKWLFCGAAISLPYRDVIEIYTG